MNAAKIVLWLMFIIVPCFIRYVSLNPKPHDFGGWWDSEGIVLCIVLGLISGGILCAM